MPNHLKDENSPYLLQHAENPVDWYPWGEAALAKARREDKPIFLSIGYASCHWCHVMARESFEDEATAAILNEHFVSIKVDREERPDLDSLYMAATIALSGAGGWPMSVFLTPDLKPFYAGTYFPPVPRHSLPAFKEVLLHLAEAWQNQRDQIHQVGERLAQHLNQVFRPSASDSTLTEETLRAVTRSILEAYDWGYGGWGEAPKFPQPMLIDFLLQRHTAGEEGALKAALHALEAMARGGMYDVLGGGFARYSTDRFWRVPHFEKMLYDNALLTLAYLHAWQITHKPLYKRVVIETLDFVAREMTHPEGGFYASLSADSQGEEGKYYVWTKDEIQRLLEDQSDFEFFSAAYGLSERGNWEGRMVLQRALDDATLAGRFGLEREAVASKLAACHSALLAARRRRVPPASDDKILTAWNGLMLQAFAEAARFLDDPQRAANYHEAAVRNAEFLLRNLAAPVMLSRSWRNGRRGPQAFLDDHAALILGLLALYQTDFEPRWFASARELTEAMLQRFSDPAGGFFDTPAEAASLLLRPKDLQDNATPSGNALACEALLKMAAFTNEQKYRDLAENALRLISIPAPRYPLAFARWLCVADSVLRGERQAAVLYETWDEQVQALIQTLRAEYRPNLVVAASAFPPAPEAPPLLFDRPLLERRPTVYVCERFYCRQPLHAPAELQNALGPPAS